MRKLPYDPIFKLCKVADHHFSSGIHEQVVLEQRLPEAVPIRLIHLRQPPGSYPDPAIEEISLQIFTQSSGFTHFDLGLGHRTSKIVQGLLAVAPSKTDCDYEIDETIDALVVNISSKWLKWALEPDFPDFSGEDFGAVHEDTFFDKTIATVASRLWVEANNGVAGRIFLESGTLAIAALLLERSGQNYARQAPKAGGLAPFLFKRVEAIINDRMSESLSISELAGEVGLSAFHFIRAFKISTGETPHRYILSQRLARARGMLTNTDLNITEIALSCGFASSQHFATAFKKEFATSPSSYRAEMRL